MYTKIHVILLVKYVLFLQNVQKIHVMLLVKYVLFLQNVQKIHVMLLVKYVLFFTKCRYFTSSITGIFCTEMHTSSHKNLVMKEILTKINIR